MNKHVFVQNFNGREIYRLDTTAPYSFQVLENAPPNVVGFGQQFRKNILTKKINFIALFCDSHKLFLIYNSMLLDVTNNDYKFITKYVGFWRIKFEVLLNGIKVFSTYYAGCKSDLYSAPMDENIFQEIITRLETTESKLRLLEYFNQSMGSQSMGSEPN